MNIMEVIKGHLVPIVTFAVIITVIHREFYLL
jgi:hypothetical protein